MTGIDGNPEQRLDGIRQIDWPALRRAALILLRKSPWAATKLAHACGVNRPQMSHALRILRDRGHVVHRGAWAITPEGSAAIDEPERWS